MAIIRGTFRFFGRHLFNVRRWSDYDQMRDSARDIKKAGKAVFSRPKIQSPETFEEAMRRMNLTEEDLAERYSTCRSTFYFFVVIAAALLVYAVYLLFSGLLLGALLAGAVGSMVGILSFKYHFWMFQIKHRKLGCSFQEWRAGKIKNNNNG